MGVCMKGTHQMCKKLCFAAAAVIPLQELRERGREREGVKERERVKSMSNGFAKFGTLYFIGDNDCLKYINFL